jgi:hypothetical protein
LSMKQRLLHPPGCLMPPPGGRDYTSPRRADQSFGRPPARKRRAIPGVARSSKFEVDGRGTGRGSCQSMWRGTSVRKTLRSVVNVRRAGNSGNSGILTPEGPRGGPSRFRHSIQFIVSSQDARTISWGMPHER